MIASVRFWRAVRDALPDAPELDALAVRLRHEPPQGRKRHMAWDVPLSPAEDAAIRRLLLDPPTPYLAFLAGRHWVDPLLKARP